MTELIYLEWIDSASADGWHLLSDYMPGPILVRSIGWLHHEDETVITIASSVGHQDADPPNQACGWITIPKGCIRQRRTIAL